MKIILLFCFFTLINCWLNIFTPSTIYYKSLPYEKNNKNITFVLWTGNSINPIHYEKFIKNIQIIGIQKRLNIEAFVSKNCDLPENKTNIFLFGHLLGGYRTLLASNKNITAKMVYGIYNNNKDILTISGEFDKNLNILKTKNSIIAKNNYHLSICNGKTNNLMSLFDKNTKIQNNNKLCLDIANICIEFILLTIKETNCLNYYIYKSEKIYNITNSIHKNDKNIFVNYLILKLYNSFKHYTYYNFYNFILSSILYNNINSYVDLNHIWLKTNKPKINITILNKIYNKALLKKKLKIRIIKHYNIMSWILSKCYHKSNKIYIHHFNFLSLNYYKIPTMYYILTKF